jgi:predicted RNA-binding protein with PUA-like domain
MHEWCIKVTKQLGKHLYQTELSIFNLMLQQFKLSVFPLSPDIYCVYRFPYKESSSVKILHSVGQPKFWNGLRNESWENNYQEWIKIGGTRLKKRTLLYYLKEQVKKVLNIRRKIKDHV